MAIIRIEDGTNADDIECIFHTVSKNTWSIVGGATAILMPVDAGTWSSHGVDNRIEFFDSSGAAIGLLTGIDVAVSLTDPFDSVKVGDSGDGTVGSQLITWTIISK